MYYKAPKLSDIRKHCCNYLKIKTKMLYQRMICPKDIHVISPYFGGSSLYFIYFLKNLPTKIFRISYISYISPYLEFQISLPKFKNSLLCLIILPILKGKSPYLSSGMYHMSAKRCRWNDKRVKMLIRLLLFA